MRIVTCVTVLALAACSTAQLPSAPSNPLPGGATLANDRHPGKTWMLRGAASGDLLYVTDVTGDVYVYTYPTLKPAGEISGLGPNTNTECSDKHGNVFVLALESGWTGEIFEYAHGGTTPIATFSDPYDPLGCSVDSTTGNLAVADSDVPNQLSYVAIYKNARGTPAYYDAPASTWYDYCGYDDAGNLFVSGLANSTFLLAELPRNGATFTPIAVDQNLAVESSVQWDGTYITVTRMPERVGRARVLRLAISGSTATVAGTTKLLSSTQHFDAQDAISGSTVVVPYGFRYDRLGVWRYPAGGMPTHTQDAGFEIAGVAVSRAR